MADFLNLSYIIGLQSAFFVNEKYLPALKHYHTNPDVDYARWGFQGLEHSNANRSCVYPLALCTEAQQEVARDFISSASWDNLLYTAWGGTFCLPYRPVGLHHPLN